MTRLNNSTHLESPDFPFHIGEYRFVPGQVVELHSHEFIEFVFVSSGSGTHISCGSEYPIREGDVYVIEPDAEHGYISDTDKPLTVFNILIAPHLLKRELQALSAVSSFVDFFYVEPFLRETASFHSRLTLTADERLEMVLMLERLSEEYNEKRLGYRLLVKTRLIDMFVFLSRCYSRLIHKPTMADAPSGKTMQRIAEFIRQRHASPLTLAQVSRMCDLSPSAFAAKFKQQVGKTFVEYRNDIRLEMARNLLAKTDYTILRVSQEVGFDDLSFFNKLFKQETGLTPGQYRKRYAESD
ncbi:MAG: hypothetical protein K0Q59_4566 [Paenibacillus sp.]|jgi:AraC family L-rhamnose operon regulatory protein RhaS|nr:hypothetical protein [Paenibacillus sp.]